MKHHTSTCRSAALLRFFKATLPTQLLALSVLLISGQTSFAGSATWKASPGSNDWNTASNWTPATIPNGPFDTATFAVSLESDLSIVPGFFPVNIEVNGIVFDPGASSFHINVAPNTITAASLTLSGAGIINNSGIIQKFQNFTNGYTNGAISFTNNATAGSLTTFVNYGGYNSANGAVIHFFDHATAGGGTFTNVGGLNLPGGTTQFSDHSTAGGGNFTNMAGRSMHTEGTTQFFGNSTAANGTFTNAGGSFSGSGGGSTFFFDFSTAGNGRFINNGSSVRNAGGGATTFVAASTAAMPH